MNSIWIKERKNQLKIAAGGVLLLLSLSSFNGCTQKGDQYQGIIDQPVSQRVENGIFKIDGNLLTTYLEQDGVTLNVEWCQPDLIRVEYLKKNQASEDTLAIGNDTWELMPFQYDISKEKAVLSTADLIVTVDLKNRKIIFAKPDGTFFASESFGKIIQEGQFKLQLGETDNFYGLHGYDAWENSEEGMLRNNGGLVKAGQQGSAGGPLLWSTSGYGLVFDSASGRMNLNKGDLTYTHNTSGGKEYYVLTGTPVEMFSTVADLTGHAPMFPKWAMGFHHSEWGIDEKEMKETVDAYRKRQLPLDHYILDFDWKAWGEDDYGEFRWNETKFPSGKDGTLSRQMADKGVKISGILKPRIHVKTVQGQYATDHDFWWPKRQPSQDYFSKQLVNGLNFAKEEVRNWFYDHNKLMLESGFAGYWNDEADEGYDSFQHMNMQRSLYEGQRSQTDQRVWSINRNFYLGAQRYAYGMWSGDINSGFESMKMQRERMLSAVNVGEMKWGMDTGGFNGAEPTPENYARWMQMSAFSPTFRVHGRENKQRQPWAFGEQAESVSKAAMTLRYRLIPYIYTYEREAFETGLGIVRPIAMMNPDETNAANYVDGWFFGDWLYVAPVVDEGQINKAIYLPKGEWMDYHKGTVYSGEQTIEYPIRSKTWEDIPLFVKSGAIIPTQEAMAYVGEKPVEVLTLDLFPNKETTSFTWYDDDGSTYAYEGAAYFKQKINLKNALGIHINLEKPEGTYKTETQFYQLKIHGISGKTVKINGERLVQNNDFSLFEKERSGFMSQKDVYGDVTIVYIPVGEVIEVVAE